MRQNINKLFLSYGRAKARYTTAHAMLRARFAELLRAVAEDRYGGDVELTAKGMNWWPCPPNGNRIMSGEREPSDLDIERLFQIWRGMQ